MVGHRRPEPFEVVLVAQSLELFVERLSPNTAKSDAEEGSSLSIAGFLRFLSLFLLILFCLPLSL